MNVQPEEQPHLGKLWRQQSSHKTETLSHTDARNYRSDDYGIKWLRQHSLSSEGGSTERFISFHAIKMEYERKRNENGNLMKVKTEKFPKISAPIFTMIARRTGGCGVSNEINPS